MATSVWQLSRGRSIALDRPRLLGIVNVTPDSFADGGRLPDAAAARDHALKLVADGADAIDVGGESTRPGAEGVPPDEQAARVVPVIALIRAADERTPITVDTTRAAVARAAFEAGADAVNDVSAGTDDPAMLDLCAREDRGIVLMHRLRRPGADSFSDRYTAPPAYTDVVREIAEYLRSRADAAVGAGVPRERIVVDPGLGFGKTVEQNLELIRRTREIASLGFPVLSALSRKSFVGRAGLGRDSIPAERLAPTLALSVTHLHAGAAIFRVHDVAEHAAALRAAAAATAP